MPDRPALMRVTGNHPWMPRLVSGLLGAIWLAAAWQVMVIPESAIQMTVGACEVPAAVATFLGLREASDVLAVVTRRFRKSAAAKADPAQTSG